MTDYVVLQAETELQAIESADDEPGVDAGGREVVTAWKRLSPMGTEHKVYAATSPDRAVKAAREDLELLGESGIFVAVPARSWKPERRWTESRPQEKSEPVDA